jgi:phosphate transport system protein
MFSMFRDEDQLDTIEHQLIEMLDHCTTAYDLATAATFGEADLVESGTALRSIDRSINETERAIRRELVVHGSVRGAEVDQGLMLTYMSVAKDIERIGDKCKDIWGIAHMGANLGRDVDSEDLQLHREAVGELIEETRNAFRDDDVEAAHALIQRIGENSTDYDTLVLDFVMSDLPARHAAPRALFYRYIKRLSGHLSNVLSSLVMPVDHIDFYDESLATDAPGS